MSLLVRIAAVGLALTGPASSQEQTRPEKIAERMSPYLLVFAGDEDGSQQDFIAVIDVRPGSPTAGRVVATRPVGTTASMPHHFEYELPGKELLLFANSHHHEETLLVDVGNPLKPQIVKRLRPPPPYRFTHDYKRLPNGNVLVGFLRSEGASPRAGDATLPGGHGGIAEYRSDGTLIRTASAAAANVSEPVRPYALIALLDRDRILTTSAAMMEESAANVVQIWRYSDFKLLHTIPVPPGRRADGSPVPTAARAPFAARAMADGSILINTYGCGLYRLTDVTSDRPRVANIFTFDASEPTNDSDYRGACAVPLLVDDTYWIMPIGRERRVVTLDLADPSKPREVSRLNMPHSFAPHWLARDPRSDRVVLGAHQGGQEGMFILRLEKKTGRLRFDSLIRSPSGRVGYIGLTDQKWPHGPTGPAWAHAGLFLADSK